MNIYHVVIIVLYFFAGYSYLRGMIELEEVTAEVNIIGKQVKIEADPISTPILDHGFIAKALIIVIWPGLVLLAMYYGAKKT